MKKIYLAFLFICIMLIVGCKQEPQYSSFPEIKSIKDVTEYDSIGVGAISSGARAVDGTDNYIVGYLKSGEVEAVTFVDEEGNDVSDKVTVTQYNQKGNYLFVCFSYNYELAKYFCIYLPTGDMFEITKYGASFCISAPNDMQNVCNDAVYFVCDGIIKVHFENGQLIIEQICNSTVAGFDFIIADKYGNVFGSDWSKGHLLTANGKLRNLPSTMTYRKGMNDIVYFENNGEKGFFDKDGNQKIIDEGFYPDFVVDDIFSSNCRFYDIIEYVDGSKHYYFCFEEGGFNCFRGNLFEVDFSDNGEYTERIIKNLESNFYPNYNLNDLRVRGYSLLGKYLFVLASNRFFKIDMTTGDVSVVNDEYYEYKTLDLVGEEFRISAIDEDMNNVVFCIDANGNKTVVSKYLLEVGTVHLFPCNR